VHSAQSGEASKASASPISDQHIGNNPPSMNAVDPQLDQQPTVPKAPLTTIIDMQQPLSTTLQHQNAVSHAAKVARMEVPADAAHGLAGGVPPKIEEAIEPDT
jgi:hypothetical protein